MKMCEPIKDKLEKVSVNCNLCGDINTQILYTIVEDNQIFRILKCKSCGLVYTYSRLDNTEIREVYSMPEYQSQLSNEEKLVKTAQNVLKKIQKYKNKGKLLEIGCARGLFIKIAQDIGWIVKGVEVSKGMSSFARDVLCLDVFNGTLEEANFLNDIFDVVVMIHTLEHMPDPLGTLKKIHCILKKGGLVLISVPNMNSFKAKISKEKWTALMPKYHLYHFTPNTLKKMLKCSSFKVLKMETSSPFAITEKLQKIGISKKEETKDFISRYFLWLKTFLKFGISILIQGEGLVVYAKKV